MSTQPYRLSSEVRSQIIAGIRAGGYPQIAAEAWGMPRECFDEWMRLARQPKAREPYRSFAKEVRLAQAQARLAAEMTVFKDDPKIWLIHGPGREARDNPGWSVSVKPAELALDGRNVLLDPELMQVFRTVLQALEPHPEARADVAQALTKLGIPTTFSPLAA